MPLPALLSIEHIQQRLTMVSPEGTTNRTYCTRLAAARTVFAMLYIGAIQGEGRWLAPKQVYRMSDAQACRTEEADRIGYAVDSMKPRFDPKEQRWYADNSREPIRDETLKEGLVRVGAVVVRGDLPTTSGYGRYALQTAFAELFNPELEGDELAAKIVRWQKANLGSAELARIQILRRGGGTGTEKVRVTFPNGELRQLEPGPSSVISKAVIEEFAPRFLKQPAVILLSESGNKIIARDDVLVQAIGLKIEVARVLPDVILFDLQPGKSLLVFVEVVATDGPISASRKNALLEIATAASFPSDQVAFVTAYRDRNDSAFKKTVPTLAWRSFAWFVSEPDHIVVLHEGSTSSPAHLLDLMH